MQEASDFNWAENVLSKLSDGALVELCAEQMYLACYEPVREFSSDYYYGRCLRCWKEMQARGKPDLYTQARKLAKQRRRGERK